MIWNSFQSDNLSDLTAYFASFSQGLHCVLPLGLDCVRRLHRSEIFPVIIFIGVSARNARKLKYVCSVFVVFTEATEFLSTTCTGARNVKPLELFQKLPYMDPT